MRWRLHDIPWPSLTPTSRFSNATLEFVAAPALAPAEVSVDPELMKQYEQELKMVCVLSFPLCAPLTPI